FLCRTHGMQLLFTNRESYRDKPALFNKYCGDDNTAFFIDEGGASPEAAKGCSELITELDKPFNHIFCACGTGTTAAGIINGIKDNGFTAEFHAVPVLKGDFMKAEIDRYLVAPHPYHLHSNYHFGGYAKTTPELIDFVKEFTALTGILIEPVYTGKLFYAIFDLIKAGHFKPGSRILAVHTGGLLGLLGMRDKF
ncbi:MAG: pyridoxal-phosphate dependent enzyme, partial [Sphingobacteriaceae bacterium]